jgi:ABC-2 type transport system permease protein
MTNKVWLVARREYVVRVRTLSFWIGTLLLPALFAVLLVGSALLATVESPRQRVVSVADASGALVSDFRDGLAGRRLKDGRPEWVIEVHPWSEDVDVELADRLNGGDLFALVTIGPELDAAGNYRFYGRHVSDLFALTTLQDALFEAVVSERLRRAELDMERDRLKALLAPIQLQTFQSTEGGSSRRKGFGEAYFGTLLFTMVLYMALLLNGATMMRSILEEKTSRIMEILMGSLTPDQLMSGKILGIGAVGLTQMAVYAISAGSVRGFTLRSEVSDNVASFLDVFTPLMLCSFMVFFVLGYFLYSSLFAAVGAVCSTEQEAQSLMGPIVGLLVIPMLGTFYFATNPDAPAAVVLSLIPLFTPMVMFMRISTLMPPLWQVLLSVVLTTLFTAWVFRLVGKVFRVGVLLTGKRPSLAEIWRWARA